MPSVKSCTIWLTKMFSRSIRPKPRFAAPEQILESPVKLPFLLVVEGLRGALVAVGAEGEVLIRGRDAAL